MERISIKIALVGALVLINGCARNDLFVLLPDKEGKTGALVVSTASGDTVLNSPYAAATMKTESRAQTASVTQKDVQEVFGNAIANQPTRPISFTIYFLTGEYELTPEAKPVVDQVFAEIASRPAPEVVVIGHTDRVGQLEYNDSLSLQRAQRVRDELIQLGIPAERIYAAGRGEREPVVLTDDEVSEPRNRRVEISVR